MNRFVPEKNLSRLVHAYSRYREAAPMETAWDLVLCGDGPSSGIINAVVSASGYQASIHRPGFLQVDDLSRWYAFASAFVHPSLMEPWGLVVNEAAACGLPLLVSDRAGCAETLVPDGPNSTGRQFDPQDVEGLASQLAWMAGLSTADRLSLGRRAAEIVSCWGPDRFAHGTIEALQIAVVAEEIKEAAFA